MKPKKLSTLRKTFHLLLPILAMSAALPAADVEVNADVTADTFWTSDTTYILRKTIFVKNNATLTIEPGTLILGANATGPDGQLDTADDTYGSLVVTRGAKLQAEGTVDKPIVMTALAERDGIGGDPGVKPDPSLGDGGFWGGLILLGRAPINYYVGGVNANENDIEGFPAGSSDDITYGGSDPGDSSGVIKYVSIRFGGYVFNAQTGSEINALTMGGVGSGTVVENIEVISNTDDGVEIFGGTVNTKRIAVAFCQDDSFDLDEGHQGFHQFWFSLQNADSTIGDRGGEWDGGNGSPKSGTPYNTIRVYNATILGNGTDTASPNPGFFLTDFFAGQLHNSLVHDFSGAAITSTALGAPAPDPAFFNNTWGSFVGGAGTLSTYATAANGNTESGTDPLLVGISRDADRGLDPRPNLGSPLYTSSLSGFPMDAPAGFFETVNYRGAFGGSNWLNGWSWLSRTCYLSGLPDVGTGGGEGGEPPFADVDADGVSDTLEAGAALQALGFTVGVNDVSPTNLFANLYTEDSILDLVTGSEIMVQASGANVTVSLPLFRSADLSLFGPAPALQASFEKELDKEFYRIEIDAVE